MNNKALGAWLKLVNPTRSYITADELHNFRIWAKIQIHKRQNGSTHQASLITEDALKEMFKDTISNPGLSIAVEDASKIFQQLLRDTMNENNNSWQVENYLQLLKEQDEAFDYFIGRDVATGAASIVVWQTGSMRAYFELFSSIIHVDVMARKLNSHDLLTCPDANGSPRQIGEGITCSERAEAYVSAITGLISMSPGVSQDSITGICADGILGPSILDSDNMNLPSAHFIWDCHHLTLDCAGRWIVLHAQCCFREGL